MVTDPQQISLYTLAHDWWGVGAFAFGIYKVLSYLQSFKVSSETANKKIDQVKTDLTGSQSAIRHELKEQTDKLVAEFREMRSDFRTMFLVAQPPPRPAPRPTRAKRTTVAATKILVDKRPTL